MSSKYKRGSADASASGRTPRQEVDRLIEKGWFKDAIKQGKLLHRAEPTPEHHRLLEKAFFLRARELREGGMRNAAQEVAGHLLDFGITDPELTEPAAALLMAVGLGRQAMDLQGRLASPEAVDRLARQAADVAVLHPELKSSATSEILEGAKRIRDALGALTTSDAPGALDGLRDVSRNSPFADWRLFARGLAASRKGDAADAKANWERLDPARAASRIASALAGATEAGPADAPPSPKLEALERRAFGEPILGPLRDLGTLIAQGAWPEAVRKLGPIRLALRRVDPALAVRLTRAMYTPLIRHASELGYREADTLLKAFTKAAEPLPIDHRWNRLWALAWEGPQGHPAEADPFWRRYLGDLQASPALRDEERPIARALVLAHQGREWDEYAREFDPEDGEASPGRKPDPESVEARRTAASLLEESLGLFPSHRPTYRWLMDVHEAAGRPEKVAEVASRLIGAIPDDFETLEFLARHLRGRDDPAKALEYAIRARKLKPLDRVALNEEWSCRVAFARHHANDGRFADARAELEAASKLEPNLANSPHFDARKACLELKAGDPEAAKAIVDEALARFPDPAPFRLAMAIESRRHHLPKDEVERQEDRWLASISGKVRAEAAGEMAAILAAFLNEEVDYPGRGRHIEIVMGYVGRSTRLKYSRDALAGACTFVSMVPGHGDLFEKLAKRGLKLFPTAPEFPMMLGSIEMAKGPYRDSLKRARGHFESALKLAQAEEATNPKLGEMIARVREALTSLDYLFETTMGLPYSPFGAGGPPASILDAFEAMMTEADDEDFFDPDDDDDPGPAPRPPRPKPKKKKKR